MASLLDLCERYFGARNFYDVLKIPKSANDKQVKKAYYKLSLLVHPDRVEDDIKAEATEKFKVLGGIYSILSDNEKRKAYDESGQCDEKIEEFDVRKLTDDFIFLLEELFIIIEDLDWEIQWQFLLLVFNCFLVLKYDKEAEVDVREFTIDCLNTLNKKILTVENNNDKKPILFSIYLCLLLLKKLKYEEVGIICKWSINYLRVSLEEISTIENRNYKKLKLFSVFFVSCFS
ncbi:dnaJ homolog subfamily C member 1-like isoform X1 [Cataglyphis hispanica]|uniref:dnaJ homolog subfamily C member 1-like isoform X1 n=1 Tax=Cataglyphis hispanica TaxID=1086592 RepID=UPI00217F7E26|nr:dnaJ homolog subfamily C member 1-like isoform X1 [Cataglyphis hispanica]